MGYRGHARKVNNIEYGAESCSTCGLLSDLIYHYKEENDIEMQAHCSASGFVCAAAGLSDDGGSAGESG